MDDQNQILDLSHLPPQQILFKIKKLLEQADYDKFTLFLKKNPDSKSKKNTLFPLKITELNERKPYPKPSALYTRNSNRNSSFAEDQNFYGLKNSFNSSISGFGTNQKDKQNLIVSEFEDIIQSVEFYSQGNYEQAISILLDLEFDIIQSNRLYWKQNSFLEQNDKTQQQKNDVKIVKDAKLYGQVTFHLANCYYRIKNYDEAIKYYKKEVVEQAEKIKGQRMNNLGSCYAIKQQVLLSLKYYSEAWKIYQNIPEIDCSNLLNNIGILYFKTGMYETAEKYFSESINARKGKSRNEQVLYFSYFKMGQCLKYQKRYQESLNSFLFAMNIAEKAKSFEHRTGQYCNTLKQLGLIYQTMEKWQDALANYEKLSQAEDNTEIGQGYIYERVANIHQRLGNENQFKKFMKIAYEEYRRQGNERKMSQLCVYTSNNIQVSSSQ